MNAVNGFEEFAPAKQKEAQNIMKTDTLPDEETAKTTLNPENEGQPQTENSTIIRNKEPTAFVAQIQTKTDTYEARESKDGAVTINKRRRPLDHSAFYLEDEEIKRLLEGARTFQERLILELAVYCGLRRAEVVGLNAEDIDFDRQLLHLKTTKGSKPRECPAPSEVITRLSLFAREHSRTRGAVFRNAQGKRLQARTINRIVERTSERAGLTHPANNNKSLNPHLLRHTFARRYLRAGGRMEVLQRLLGHSSITTTIKIYGAPSLKLIQEDYYKTVKTV